MSDDLDDLKSAFGAATPAPDATRRAENLALAQKNFEALQGSREAARPTPVTAPSGLWTGFKNMLTSMTSPGALSATTALVACGFIFLTPIGQDMWREADVPLAQADDVVLGELSAEADTTLSQEENVAADTAIAPLAEAAPEPAHMLESFAANALTEEADAALETRTRSAEGVASAPSSDGVALNAPRRSAAPRSLVEPSITRGFRDAEPAATVADIENEVFANAPPTSLTITQETPVSTFSIDVDTASYALLRSSITQGQLPHPEQVRIEELINYFPYDYPAPDAGGAPFRPTVSTMQTPWNADTQLVHIAIQGQMPLVDNRPPLNLVFLIDTSGSMNQPNKLPLLKTSLGLMLAQLRAEDQIAIVAYAGSAGQVLAPTSAADQSTILTALNGLGAGGSTNGQGGLQQAYAVAESMQAEGEVNRIILATDGDFNVGINDPEALNGFIADKRDTGTYLSILGFGRSNLDDATMQALAQNGNGQAAYIDTLAEAQKVLVDQLTGELFPIAGDVKIQVEWNPAEVAEYRLIGYETRSLAREDFNNDKVDAGELGAGHTVTAIYEITPVGSPAQLSDPLRYDPAQVADRNGEFGFLKLRYKDPGADESQLLTTPIVPTKSASSEAYFAAAIAGFGQLLRDDRFLGTWDYAEAIALANAHRGADPFGYRTEAVQLMRLAQSLAGDPGLRIQGRSISR
jgi:Ca-activated chloride channel family protein